MNKFQNRLFLMEEAVFVCGKMSKPYQNRVLSLTGSHATLVPQRKAPCGYSLGGLTLMDQIMLTAVCRIIVGRTGRRLPAYVNIQEAYVNGLFADYHLYNPVVSTKTYYKYANASTPFPHLFARHYGGSTGYRRTLSDMMGICDACTSITLLRQIQDELYRWVSAYLPAEEACAVCQHYIASDAGRREISVFFADVMHHALCRENDGNRPTDVNKQP